MLSLHCHYHNDVCIKMGSDKSHFNVSLIVRGTVTRQCPQTTTGFFSQVGYPVDTPYRLQIQLSEIKCCRGTTSMFGCCPDSDVIARPSTFSVRIALGESRIRNDAGFETYS